MMRMRLSTRIALAVGFFVAYTVIATQIFLRWSGLLHSLCKGPLSPEGVPTMLACFDWPLYQWWLYLYDFLGDGDDLTGRYLLISGGGAAGIVGLILYAIFKKPTGGWSLQRGWPPRGAPEGAIRTPTDHFGKARFKTDQEMIDRWPGEGPHGGVVVGHAFDPILAGERPFHAHARRTWGRSGRMRPLIDPGTEGTTHWTFIGPSGSMKSMALIPTLLHWRSPMVVLDPKGELAPMVYRARRALGHDVFVLDINTSADVGFDVLDWIDISRRSAESDIGALIEAVCGPPQSAGGSSRYFNERGKAMNKCLAAHMMWDKSIPREAKTLERLRNYISLDQDTLRQFLKRIHTSSNSRLAGLIAGPLSKIADETFGGIHSNADNETTWLTVEANAKMVSGNSFHSWDICNGTTDVFLSLSLKVLQSAPALARCILWAFLNAAYEAEGNVQGRMLFALDEIRQIGYFAPLMIAGGLGRAYGITIAAFYQDPHQLQAQWQGVPGAHEWLGHMSGVSYSCVNLYSTAKELSDSFGTYGGLVWSQSQQRGGMFGGGQRNGGGSLNFSEREFKLVLPSQILNETPRNVHYIAGGGGELPTRCARPLYFCNPRWAKQVEPSHFYTRRAPAPIPAPPSRPRAALVAAPPFGPGPASATPGPKPGLTPQQAAAHEMMLDPGWWEEEPP